MIIFTVKVIFLDFKIHKRSKRSNDVRDMKHKIDTFSSFSNLSIILEKQR